jgi:hypothetical protein
MKLQPWRNLRRDSVIVSDPNMIIKPITCAMESPSDWTVNFSRIEGENETTDHVTAVLRQAFQASISLRICRFKLFRCGKSFEHSWRISDCQHFKNLLKVMLMKIVRLIVTPVVDMDLESNGDSADQMEELASILNSVMLLSLSLHDFKSPIIKARSIACVLYMISPQLIWTRSTDFNQSPSHSDQSHDCLQSWLDLLGLNDVIYPLQLLHIQRDALTSVISRQSVRNIGQSGRAIKIQYAQSSYLSSLLCDLNHGINSTESFIHIASYLECMIPTQLYQLTLAYLNPLPTTSIVSALKTIRAAVVLQLNTYKLQKMANRIDGDAIEDPALLSLGLCILLEVVSFGEVKFPPLFEFIGVFNEVYGLDEASLMQLSVKSFYTMEESSSSATALSADCAEFRLHQSFHAFKGSILSHFDHINQYLWKKRQADRWNSDGYDDKSRTVNDDSTAFLLLDKLFSDSTTLITYGDIDVLTIRCRHIYTTLIALEYLSECSSLVFASNADAATVDSSSVLNHSQFFNVEHGFNELVCKSESELQSSFHRSVLILNCLLKSTLVQTSQQDSPSYHQISIRNRFVNILLSAIIQLSNPVTITSAPSTDIFHKPSREMTAIPPLKSWVKDVMMQRKLLDDTLKFINHACYHEDRNKILDSSNHVIASMTHHCDFGDMVSNIGARGLFLLAYQASLIMRLVRAPFLL